MTGAIKRALDGIIDALTDPAQRDRAVLVVLGGYLLVWTLYGVVAKGNQDLHSDMTELIGWSRNLALGFPKHPPFAAVVVRGWFALFPIADWSYYLLAILTSALALWIAWQLFADYLDPAKRLVALALLTFIPFFNFHALKFNVNTVLMPLWAVATYWFLRSYTMRSPAYAALAGVAAAFCMLCKYWSIFLLGGLVVAALLDKRRSAYFRSTAPWITIAVGVAVLSPHIGWLQKHQFSTMEYAVVVHGGKSFGETALAAIRYLIDSLAYASVPIAVVLLVTRPSRKTIVDMVWPADSDRRLVASAFWATLLLPTVASLLWGVSVNGLWSMSYWTLLPVLLLSSPSVQLGRTNVTRIVGSALALPLIMLIAAPAIALVVHQRGLPPELTQSKILTQQVEKAWRAATVEPLSYVGGDITLAYSVLTYAQDRPQALLDLPQLPAARLRERGVALACFVEDGGCAAQASKIASLVPASRKSEIELSRSYFGIPGRPQRYLIVVVPPQPSHADEAGK